VELAGKKSAQTGLEGKFSFYHAVAAALVDGTVGENSSGSGRSATRK
jgi:hypothetical protein